MTGGDSSGDGSSPVNPPGTRFELVRANLRELLEENVTYDGWEHQTGQQKAFYVRGFTWFRDNVLKDRGFITECEEHIPRMTKIISERPAWTDLPFQWTEKFGPRQFIDAASINVKLTPKFHKAAQVIALCEAWADALHKADDSRPNGKQVYDHMRVEAGVSHIHGFDRTIIDTLTAEQADLLLSWTGQPSLDVFYNMADGHTVTNKLARWTLNFLRANLPLLKVGRIDVRFNPRRKYTPSRSEYVDVKQRNLPSEARAALTKSQLA